MGFCCFLATLNLYSFSILSTRNAAPLAMPAALKAKNPVSFEIKSANLALMALRLKSPDLQLLAREMDARFGDMPGFFDQDLVVIDLSALQKPDPDENAPEIDFSAMVALLTSYRLVPIAVRAGNSAQMTAALAAYLLPLPEMPAAGSRVASSRATAIEAANTESLPEEKPAEVASEIQDVPVDPVPPTAAIAPGALIIDRPLRSGQQVYARGRDLVLLAMVNPGAEVIADGHIHVYAPLRGKAIAGARGNTEARIFSLALDAELLSIAGVYRTSDTPIPQGLAGQPVQVRLVSDESSSTNPGPGTGKLVMSRIGN